MRSEERAGHKIALQQNGIGPITRENRSSFVAQADDNFGQRVGSEAILGRDGDANVVDASLTSAAVGQRSYQSLAASSLTKVVCGSRHCAISQDHCRGCSFNVERMTNVNLAGEIAKYAEIAAGTHDSGRNSIAEQCVNRAIDREPLGDSAKIDHHSVAKEDPVIFLEKDISRSCRDIKTITATWKIIPLHEKRSDRDIKHAVALLRKPLGRLQDLPGPWVHGNTFGKCIAIHAGNVALRIMKTHQPMDFSNGRKSCINPAFENDAALSACRDFDKRAEERAATANFNV